MNKETLLDALNAMPPYTFTMEGIATYLNVDSIEQRITLLKLIQQCVDEGFIFESKKFKLATRDHLKFKVGVFKYKNERFGFVECDNDESYYCASSDSQYAFDQDKVLIRIHPVDKSCSIVKILDHQIKKLVGEVVVNERKGRLSYRCSLFSYPIFVNVDLKQLSTIKEDSYVLFNIDTYGIEMKCSIDQVIAPMSGAFADIDCALLEHGIALEYPKDAVIDAMKSGSQPIIRTENRTDLRNLLTMTIDGEDAKDFDDALSYEKTDTQQIVYVSIADVSTYVEEGSELDKEAYRRGTSIYVPGKVIPMLPFELSNGACSLNPNVDRYALTCKLIYDLQGNYIESEIFPSIIKSNYRMTYTNVNKIFNGDLSIIRKYTDLVVFLNQLLMLAQTIDTNHKKEGGVSFNSNELKLQLDDKGNVVSIEKREDGLGENLIETFMIQANIAVAKYLNQHELPCVYRVHEAPDPMRFNDFKALATQIKLPLDLDSDHPSSYQLQTYLDSIHDSEYYDIINARLLRSMSKARYDSQCLGHFGLGLYYYCHFTSPIRRYPDLLVHRFLWKYVFNQQEDSSKDNASLMVKSANCSEAEVKAVDVERDITAMKVCQYMRHNIGKRYTGMISSLTNSGMYVLLPNGVDVFCPFYLFPFDCYTSAPFIQLKIDVLNKKLMIGDKVSVLISAVNEIERKIIGEFYLLDSPKKGKDHLKSKKEKSMHYKVSKRKESKPKQNNRRGKK